MPPPDRPRVALACPGIGLVQRGFERMFSDIFRVVGTDVDLTLFKGGGRPGPRERVLRFMARNGPLPRVLPVHRLLRRTPYFVECESFALAMLPHLLRGGFDVVHVIDLPLAKALFRLRRLLGLGFRLLFTEGANAEPRYYPPADHIHHVSPQALDDAVRQGVPASFQTLIPCGIDSGRFDVSVPRAELRRQHAVGAETFVVLCVAAINRSHKRTDHVIEEVARLPGDVLLWLDGSLDHGDPELVEFARQRLGDRCRVTHVPSERIGELYRLADAMVLGSLREAFGMAVVEGAVSGLPVVTHETPHFRWLFPHPEDHADMTRPGALALRLAELGDPGLRASRVRAAEIHSRFGWSSLRDAYARMYRDASELPVMRKDPLPHLRDGADRITA
jgi:glycosyltransferase involved in cell wall biosynthesis